METDRAPAALPGPDIVERTVRDFLTEDIDRVLVDNETTSSAPRNNVGQISSRSRGKIVYYRTPSRSSRRYNIERQIEQTFQRRVPLPSGGEIVIDETEALISIDVNTGSHKSRSGDEKNHHLPGQHGGGHRDLGPDPPAQTSRPRDHGLIDMKDAPPATPSTTLWSSSCRRTRPRRTSCPSRRSASCRYPPAPAGVALGQPLHRLPYSRRAS